ncbi:sensor histidine kinase [Jiangella asiatica]|uniref:sensor histidine kinase n=1 Tax=Jiangella asiatica TaxID=2530372 RepID=UPI00193CA40D|nr:ATP-binding protein [Jiangella asiatica]
MRVRLTALYGGLVLVSGLVLLTVVYVLVRGTLTTQSIIDGVDEPDRPGSSGSPTGQPEPPDMQDGWLPGVAASAREAALDNILLSSTLAVAVLAALSVAVGWWVAGRVLRRLHRVTATARDLSWQDLRRRIAMDGPRDELKELADTFDELLSRLDQAFDAQRRFAANAAHELRTPLAIERTAIQVGLRDPTPDQLREVRDQLLETNRRSERLIDGLIVLARGDAGLATREPVDLAVVVDDVTERFAALAAEHEVTVAVDARPVRLAGDSALLDQLVSNLVQNAIRYNHPGGRVAVRTLTPVGVEVTNTGPRVPAGDVDRLFEPFQRGNATRTGSNSGAGLGLSIVRAIAHAHAGVITATPNPAGGLTIHVILPSS